MTLPNLLSPTDVTRLQRLLARFIDVIPKEYRNGVQESKIVIPLEYKEAGQFTQQAQSLVNELAPVWRRDQHDAFEKYHGDLIQKLSVLQKQIDQVQDLSVIEKDAGDVGSILTNRFGLSAHRAGDKGQIIEETALDVRDSLNNSLAAAKAGHWQEAESLRLDAYTAFDSEIEIRVMPRNPTLATRTERSFLDGQGQPGIKALLDRGAPMDELTAGYERALKNLDECVALLKVSVSPATIGFTAFTILSREGLEAIVILAALLAGLRGAENIRTRRGIIQGALLGVALSGLTFWLSQTIIRSLLRFGEKLEAIVSVLAVLILLMVTNWVFHKMYWVEWNARLRDLSKTAQQVRAPFWEIFALLGVGFLTVYREGFETTIFMQSLLLGRQHLLRAARRARRLRLHRDHRDADHCFRGQASLPQVARRHRRSRRFDHGHFSGFGRALVPDSGVVARPSSAGPQHAQLGRRLVGHLSLLGRLAHPSPGLGLCRRCVALPEIYVPACAGEISRRPPPCQNFRLHFKVKKSPFPV